MDVLGMNGNSLAKQVPDATNPANMASDAMLLPSSSKMLKPAAVADLLVGSTTASFSTSLCQRPAERGSHPLRTYSRTWFAGGPSEMGASFFSESIVTEAANSANLDLGRPCCPAEAAAHFTRSLSGSSVH